MTEEDARDWLAGRYDQGTNARLAEFVAILHMASETQSLIARSTLNVIWARHIVDSLQLAALAPADGCWLDIGSGGGLPGLAIALVRSSPMVLIEPRTKRAAFLIETVERLGLRNVRVEARKCQLVTEPAETISARAVAPIVDILTWTKQNVSRETTYLLPRGETHATELAITRRAWHGQFHVEHSITQPSSGIVVARDVRSQ